MIQKNYKRTLLFTASTLVLVACGKPGFVAETFTTILASIGIESDFESQTADGVVNPGGKSVQTAEQLYRSMLTLAQVSPSAASDSAFGERRKSLPAVRDMNGITSPMWMSATNVAGAVCDKLVADESSKTDASTRTIFKEIQFNIGVNQLTSQMVNSVTSRMARNFWGRDISEAEQSILTNIMWTEFTTGVSATAVGETKNFAVGLCTVMLSSYDVLTY